MPVFRSVTKLTIITRENVDSIEMEMVGDTWIEIRYYYFTAKHRAFLAGFKIFKTNQAETTG